MWSQMGISFNTGLLCSGCSAKMPNPTLLQNKSKPHCSRLYFCQISFYRPLMHQIHISESIIFNLILLGLIFIGHIYVGRVVFSCQRQACATSGHDVVIIAWFHQEIKLSGVFEIIRVIIRVRVQICYAFFCISVVHKLCPLKKNNNALEAFKIEM